MKIGGTIRGLWWLIKHQKLVGRSATLVSRGRSLRHLAGSKSVTSYSGQKAMKVLKSHPRTRSLVQRLEKILREKNAILAKASRDREAAVKEVFRRMGAGPDRAIIPREPIMRRSGIDLELGMKSVYLQADVLVAASLVASHGASKLILSLLRELAEPVIVHDVRSTTAMEATNRLAQRITTLATGIQLLAAALVSDADVRV
jgi:hypothetical protein